mgnify:CR=1 FL=1
MVRMRTTAVVVAPASAGPRADRLVPYQFPRADGLHEGHRRSARGVRLLRAALPSAAATREQSCSRLDAASIHDRSFTRRWLPTSARGSRMPRLAATSSSAFPARPMTTSRSSRPTLERSPLTHVHVFPYSDRPGTDGVGDERTKSPAPVVRERGRRITRHRPAPHDERFRDVAGRNGPPSADARGRIRSS